MLSAAEKAGKNMEWYREMKEKETPGDTLRFYRNLHNMTQDKLAAKLGVTNRDDSFNLPKTLEKIRKAPPGHPGKTKLKNSPEKTFGVTKYI